MNYKDTGLLKFSFVSNMLVLQYKQNYVKNNRKWLLWKVYCSSQKFDSVQNSGSLDLLWTLLKNDHFAAHSCR